MDDARDTVPNPLPEPYGSLLAFLDDMDHQAASLAPVDPFARMVIERLRQQITALALIVVAASEAADHG